MSNERFQIVDDNRPVGPARLATEDAVIVTRYVEAEAGVEAPGTEHEEEFEVVGIVENTESGARYAVCYCRRTDEFLVTDEEGALLEDEALARNVVETFLGDGLPEEDG
jgi:hypothetical protein